MGDGTVPSGEKNYRADPLARYLSEKGHEVTVVCAKPRNDEGCGNEYRNIKFEYVCPYRFPRSMVAMAYRFAQLAQIVRKVRKNLEQKFDCVYAISILPAFACILAGAHKRSVLVVKTGDFYTDLYLHFGMPAQRIAIPLIWKIEQQVVNNASLIIVDSPAQRSSWNIRGVHEEKCVAIPNGFNRSLFSPKISGRPIRKRYSINKCPLVFYHGDISRIDGLDYLVKAMGIISKKVEGTKCMVVGIGPEKYERELLTLIKKEGVHNEFIFTGWIKHREIPAYIAAGDVCVAPFRLTATTRSGIAVKVVEYVGMEKPVVASESDGLRYAFGDAICYVNPEDASALAEAIMNGLEGIDDKQRNKMRAISKKLDWSNIVAHDERVIDALVNKRISDFREMDYVVRYASAPMNY